MLKNETVAIVGVGAVGQMLAYFLKTAGFRVLLYGREGRRELKLSVTAREREIELSFDDEGETQDQDVKIVFFATKAYDLPSALRAHLPKISKDLPIVLLVNGYIEPALKDIRAEFQGRILRKAVVSRGAKFDEAGRLSLSAKGEILWGDAVKATPIEERIMSALKADGFRWDESSCSARKTKWFCNTVLNTLTAAHRLPRNGDALHAEEFASLCHEVYELGLELWPEWKGKDKEDALRRTLISLITATSENENSMAVDVRLGRRTEAEFLSGYVLKIGRDVLDAKKRFPYLFALHQTLEAR